MANQNDFEGIILYRRNYKENDQLIKLFTDRFGKVMFFVRGANKRGFRLKSALLPFTIGTYIGDINPQGLSFINAAREFNQCQGIAQDIFKNAYTTYILSLVDTALEDHVVNVGLFEKTKMALKLIDEDFDAEIIMNIMEIQLLPFFGVAPQLQSCVICQRYDLPLDYSDSYGGVLCQQHWHLDPHRAHLSSKAVYFLRLFSVVKLEQINSIKVGNRVKGELRGLLDRFYDDQIGLHLKSKKFLDQMSQWQDVLKPPDEN